ncbi:MAG: DUF2007 domain-containing protein [Aureibaculum sp.]|nr:DUF2007 domain-containing protein [Aureibaculum sp.]
MNSKLIVIFEGNSIDSEVIKEILIENGINANLKNQLMGTIAPWQVSAGGFEPVKVEILSKDKDQALELIEEFKKGNNAH